MSYHSTPYALSNHFQHNQWANANNEFDKDIHHFHFAKTMSAFSKYKNASDICIWQKGKLNLSLETHDYAQCFQGHLIRMVCFL